MNRTNENHHSMSMDEKVAAACRDTGQQVIELAERTGTEIVIWRDGKIVHLTAADTRAEFNQKQERSSYADGYLNKVLDLGDISHRKVGRYRRIKFSDLLEYKKQQEHRSKNALEELADEAQELNMGY